MKRLSLCRRPILTAISVITLLVSMTACHTSRQSSAAQGHDTASMTLRERVRDVTAGYRPWTQINLPVKIAVRSPHKISLSGRIYMRRDRDIYLTLRVLGMEVANMYINSDSVYASDKLHKYYIAEPISDIFAGAALSIGNIQDALIGRAFINNIGTVDTDMINRINLIQSADNTWILAPQAKIDGDIGYQFKFSTENNLMSLVFDTGKKLYVCNYSEPIAIDGSRFMGRLNISTKVGNASIDATLTLDFNKMKQEVPASARWRQPNGYRRIAPSTLIKILKEE